MNELTVGPSPDAATPRQVHIIQGLLAIWLSGWTTVAIWVAVDIHRLAQWSDMVESAGRSLGDAASGTKGLSQLPVVGPAAAASIGNLRYIAQSLITDGTRSRTGIHQLTITLALAVAVIPCLPAVLGFAGRYAPLCRIPNDA